MHTSKHRVHITGFFSQSCGLRLPSWHQHTAALPSLGSQKWAPSHHSPLFTLLPSGGCVSCDEAGFGFLANPHLKKLRKPPIPTHPPTSGHRRNPGDSPTHPPATRNWGRGRGGKGPPKTNRDPRGGWVGQRPKKEQGQICFFDIFLMVFLNSPHREAPKKRDQKNREKMVLDFLSIFL